MMTRHLLLLSATVLILGGCGDDDRATPDRDSGLEGDGGMVDMDTGTPDEDAGTPDEDAGTPDEDAGTPEDGGTPDMDGGTPDDDAGMVDIDSGSPSDGIAEVRAAAVGTHAPALPVRDVLVSYVRPSIGTDPAGFFVQNAMTGPALFVTVDPATLTPVPVAGDTVSFDVEETMLVGGQLRVTIISGFARSASGGDTSVLVQDVSAVDVPAMLDALESELVRVRATVSGIFTGCSAPHRCAQITTAGVPTAGPGYRIRTTDAIEAAAGLRNGCEIDIGPTPLWRFTTSAQPSAWTPSEVSVVSCPPLPAPATGQVVITEIANAFSGSDDNLEWIELHNPSATETYELMGCTLEDSSAAPVAITTSVTLPPGAYVVLAGSAADLSADFTFAADALFGISDTSDLLTLRCGAPAAVVDTVDWQTGAPGTPFPGSMNGVTWQLSPAALDTVMNDTGSNWCNTPAGTMYGTGAALGGSPGAANPTCPSALPCPAPTHLVINEVDYDQTGSDTAEFVELHNPTATPVDLTGMLLVHVNGSAGNPEISRATLSGTLGAGEFLVVGIMGQTLTLPAGVTRVDFTAATSIQNGPDGMALLASDLSVIDAVAYGGAVPAVTLMMGGGTIALAEGMTGTVADTTTGSIGRVPSACDRDMPAMDWAVLPAASPGATN